MATPSPIKRINRLLKNDKENLQLAFEENDLPTALALVSKKPALLTMATRIPGIKRDFTLMDACAIDGRLDWINAMLPHHFVSNPKDVPERALTVACLYNDHKAIDTIFSTDVTYNFETHLNILPLNTLEYNQINARKPFDPDFYNPLQSQVRMNLFSVCVWAGHKEALNSLSKPIKGLIAGIKDLKNSRKNQWSHRQIEELHYEITASIKDLPKQLPSHRSESVNECLQELTLLGTQLDIAMHERKCAHFFSNASSRGFSKEDLDFARSIKDFSRTDLMSATVNYNHKEIQPLLQRATEHNTELGAQWCAFLIQAGARDGLLPALCTWASRSSPFSSIVLKAVTLNATAIELYPVSVSKTIYDPSTTEITQQSMGRAIITQSEPKGWVEKQFPAPDPLLAAIKERQVDNVLTLLPYVSSMAKGSIAKWPHPRAGQRLHSCFLHVNDPDYPYVDELDPTAMSTRLIRDAVTKAHDAFMGNTPAQMTTPKLETKEANPAQTLPDLDNPKVLLSEFRKLQEQHIALLKDNEALRHDHARLLEKLRTRSEASLPAVENSDRPNPTKPVPKNSLPTRGSPH